MRNIRSLIFFTLILAIIFAAAANIDAQKKKPQKKTYRAPAKVGIVAITENKIKTDLNGEIVYRVPSEETGDGWTNWQFSYNQPKRVEILQNNSYGNEATVEARIYAQKAISNFDGSVDRLRGDARLFYERSGGRWRLTGIENISLRHSDTGSDSPNYQPYPISAPYPTSAPSTAASSGVSIIPGGVTVPVAAGKFQSYSFNVANRATVTGKFRARGGSGNDIEAYILDEDGFVNWSNNHGAPTYYNSGRLTVGTIKTTLNAGRYYLIFNNRYAPADAKTVEVTIELRPEANMYDEIGRSYDPLGRGMTVNSVRRVYTPEAKPAPTYTAPSAPPYTPTPNPARDKRIIPDSRVSGYSIEQILSDTFNVGSRNDMAVSFVMDQRGTVRGNFNVVDGDENNIEAYIMTAGEYHNWKKYREATLNYSSGRVRRGSITQYLNQPGTYYLVFSNYYSSRGTKTIEANVYIEYGVR